MRVVGQPPRQSLQVRVPHWVPQEDATIPQDPEVQEFALGACIACPGTSLCSRLPLLSRQSVSSLCRALSCACTCSGTCRPLVLRARCFGNHQQTNLIKIRFPTRWSLSPSHGACSAPCLSAFREGRLVQTGSVHSVLSCFLRCKACIFLWEHQVRLRRREVHTLNSSHLTASTACHHHPAAIFTNL